MAITITVLKPLASRLQSHPERSGEYNNLVYACCRCNTVKQDQELPSIPVRKGGGNISVPIRMGPSAA